MQQLTCTWCEREWNRPSKRGPTPKWCSDSCRQAAWRHRVGPEVLAKRRRRAEAEQARRWEIERYHAIFKSIGVRGPLATDTARSLLCELAAADPHTRRSARALYRTAAARWHPNLQGGDEQVFKLLQEAYRIVKFLPLQ
ncbi:hypothetical protein ACFRPV_33085 [Kitasatospora sp. NPDC056808]